MINQFICNLKLINRKYNNLFDKGDTNIFLVFINQGFATLVGAFPNIFSISP